MELAVIIIYGIALTFILCYSFVQLSLVINYNRRSKKDGNAPYLSKTDKHPFVTVQLPIFNEKYVVERLIDCIANFDYPKDKLEIQVLDDSTDETSNIIEKKVCQWQDKGIDIVRLNRKDRKGFKAGALAEGLTKSKGEFIAIFDADFLPREDFLLKTLPYFQDQKLGVVQTRWEHLNRNYSMLTKLQAFGLDAHFSVEQGGRSQGGHFINFNGTGGVWRKECIEEAGGWQSDTLTEDLDLSYRAQLKGWRFQYLEDVGSPAELPAAMNALKTQQFRWTKGAAECTRKILWDVLTSKKVSFSTKIHAVFHLANSAVFLSILTITILSVPLLMVKHSLPEYKTLFSIASIFLLSLLFLGIFYYTSVKKFTGNSWMAIKKFIIEFPVFLSVSMGLSLHNAIAVLEGYVGRKTPFIRTPKFNIVNESDSWYKNTYLAKSLSPVTLLEFFLMLYAGYGIFYGMKNLEFGLLPFHIMLFFGFGYVCFSTVFQSRLAKKKSA